MDRLLRCTDSWRWRGRMVTRSIMVRWSPNQRCRTAMGSRQCRRRLVVCRLSGCGCRGVIIPRWCCWSVGFVELTIARKRRCEKSKSERFGNTEKISRKIIGGKILIDLLALKRAEPK
jgi:hypothetical protein